MFMTSLHFEPYLSPVSGTCSLHHFGSGLSDSPQVVAYKTCVDGTHGTPLDLSQLARVILVLWRHRQG